MIVLYRVDERLIHGQVTLGWGKRLEARRYVVVDDGLAETGWEQEIHRLGTPPGAEAEFVTVDEARERLEVWKASEEPIVVLTRDLAHMVRLARDRRLQGERVNLGGIHHAPGREEVRPYLFLNDEDRERIRALEREGAAVSARDLPDSPPFAGPDLLGR